MTEDKKNINISISIQNKKKLERIKRELERHREKNLGIDVAMGHVLRIYNGFIKIIKKNRTNEQYEQYLEKL